MNSDSDHHKSSDLNSESQSFLSSNSSFDEKERKKSSSKKSPQKSPVKQTPEFKNKKAKTQKVDPKFIHLPSITPPPKLSQEIMPKPDSIPEDIAIPLQEDGEPAQIRKVSKKMPKISLKRQMTQRRGTEIPGLASIKRGSFRNSQSIGEYQAVTTDIAKKGSRNSLQDIKDNSNKNKRVTVAGGTPKGLNQQRGSIRAKTSFGGATIHENSDEESASENEGTPVHEEIAEEEDDDDYLKKYQEDEQFKKVFEICEKITSPIHSEQDINDIVGYLSQLAGLKGNFDHLNKNLKNRLMDNLEISFKRKGEYLFRQGDKADYAYVILFGKVIMLLSKKSYFQPGQEPVLEDQKAEEDKNEPINFDTRKTKYNVDNYVIIEEEKKIVDFEVGKLFGEAAMMDPDKALRSLSGMAKTDCIFLLLNQEAFDILVKEKLKKEQEQLCQFIFDSVPKLKDHFQFKKVQKTVLHLFKKEPYNKDNDILREGGRSDKLYILKEGQCVVYKNIQTKDMLGMPKMKQEKIMSIEPGAIFGEEALFFDRDNSYTIKTLSPVTCLAIKYEDFRREFKRILPMLQLFFAKRNEFMLERYEQIRSARTYERKHLNSKIEKGSINVFLQKDFKNQVNFADNKTKRKLQIFFIRKELEQLQDAKKRLASELEKEKQDLSQFNPLNQAKSFASIPKMYETPSDAYVKKVISPQRILKNEFGQIPISKNILSPLNHDNHRSSVLSINQSTKNLVMHPHTHQQSSVVGTDQYLQNFRSGITLLKDKRTQSQASLQNLTKVLNHSAMKSVSVERDEDYQSKWGSSTINTPQNKLVGSATNNGTARFFDRRYVKGSFVSFKQ